jgi:hypothetical protein
VSTFAAGLGMSEEAYAEWMSMLVEELRAFSFFAVAAPSGVASSAAECSEQGLKTSTGGTAE